MEKKNEKKQTKFKPKNMTNNTLKAGNLKSPRMKNSLCHKYFNKIDIIVIHYKQLKLNPIF